MSRSHKIKILLISGGSLVGANFLDMCTGRREQFYLIATNSKAEVPTLFEFDAVYLTPPTLSKSDSFEKKILEIISLEKPDLILPCRDDDIIFLAGLKVRRPEMSDFILCGNMYTALAICDKFLSWKFSQKNKLPFVPTTEASRFEKLIDFANEHHFPLIAKPRYGYASRDIRILMHDAQLKQYSGREEYIIQKFIGAEESFTGYSEDLNRKGFPLFHSFEGIKHSIQIIIGSEGRLEGYFCSRNVNRNGVSLDLEKYDGIDAQELAYRCYMAFSSAGWVGPVNIQCQKAEDGSLWIYEFNGRVSGASAARLLMDFDELNLIIASFVKRTIHKKVDSGNTRVIRRMMDFTVPQKLYEELKTSHFYKRNN